MLQKRDFITGSVSVLVLSACAAGSTGAVTLTTAQAWIADLVPAIQAAATTYLATPISAANKALVTSIVSDLTTLNATVQSLTDATSVKSAVLQILASLNQIEPLITPFLGDAAAVFPLAVAVLQAFINDLPLPAGASSTPPAALHKLALKYKGH